mgnify:CR=1 FL=1
MILTLTIAAWLELYFGRCIQVARVAFVGIDVDFEFEAGINAHDEVVEGHAERAVDLEFHHIEVFHAVERGVGEGVDIGKVNAGVGKV